MTKSKIWLILALVVALAGVAFGAWGWTHNSTAPRFQTEYQAVLLSNGNVYFGKLEGLDTAFPILRDVYYVQSGLDANTKQPTSVLLKRGKEWHAPDYMVLERYHIVLVEPVTPGSKVASLIAASRH
jgi:hypothetical protein